MDPDIKDLVKTLGVPIEAFTRFVERIAGPAADELGQRWGDSVRFYRFKNQVRVVKQPREILANAGITPQAVPIKLLFPLLDGASLEDDDDMQTRWAALLANAANPKGSPRVSVAFISILEELAPSEARLLDRIVDTIPKFLSPKKMELDSISAETQLFNRDTLGKMFAEIEPSPLPWVGAVARDAKFDRSAIEAQKSVFGVVIGNLVRLALVTRSRDWYFNQFGFQMGQRGLLGESNEFDIEKFLSQVGQVENYNLSVLGYEFVRACRAPTQQPITE